MSTGYCPVFMNVFSCQRGRDLFGNLFNSAAPKLLPPSNLITGLLKLAPATHTTYNTRQCLLDEAYTEFSASADIRSSYTGIVLHLLCRQFFLIYSVWYNLVFSGSVYSGGVWSGGEIPCNTTQCYIERIANAVQCMSLLIVRSQ